MKPYYEDAAVKIYLGDCREILPQLEAVDLMLTDPPYPKLQGGQNLRWLGGVAKKYQDMPTVGTPWGDDTSGVQLANIRLGGFAFCSFHSVDVMAQQIPGKRVCLVTWYQRNAPPSAQNAPRFMGEYVWAFQVVVGLNWRELRTVYDILKLATGCMATERYTDDNGKAAHPAQKPICLMYALLKVGGESVVDPYCGTGTVLRAAKDLGRKAIGIEIEERYCEIAARRMRQEVLGLEPKRTDKKESEYASLFPQADEDG